MKISREVKTAFIVLGGIFLFVLGYSYLKANPIFSNRRTYYAVYKNVGGLAPATPVTINGFPVGKIISIEFLDKQGKLVVSFSIESDFQFSKNSKAELYDTGIIGGKSIQVIPVFDESGIAESGDTLTTSVKPGITELVTQKLAPLQEKVESVIIHADSLLAGINGILDPETRQGIKSSIADLSASMGNFRESSTALNKFLNAGNIQKLNNTIANIDSTTGNFAKLSNKLAEADYQKMVKNLESTVASLDKVLSKIESGEGTMGKLFTDDKMYDNLSETSRQLGLLMEDMRLNPKRYVHFSVFGKKPKPYIPPAEETDSTEND